MADTGDPGGAGVEQVSFMPHNLILRNPITLSPISMHFERPVSINASIARLDHPVLHLINQYLECPITKCFWPKNIKITMAGDDLRKLRSLAGIDVCIIADGECIWLKPLHELVSGSRYRLNEKTKATSCLFTAEMPTRTTDAFEGYFLPNMTLIQVKLEGLPEAFLPLRVDLDVRLELGLYQAEQIVANGTEAPRPISPPPTPPAAAEVFIVARVSLAGDPAIYGVYSTRAMAEQARADAGGGWEIFIRRLDVLPAVS